MIVVEGLKGRFRRRCPGCNIDVHVRINTCPRCSYDIGEVRKKKLQEKRARNLLKGAKLKDQNNQQHIWAKLTNFSIMGTTFLFLCNFCPRNFSTVL